MVSSLGVRVKIYYICGLYFFLSITSYLAHGATTTVLQMLKIGTIDFEHHSDTNKKLVNIFAYPSKSCVFYIMELNL